jgi:hypothetical protein
MGTTMKTSLGRLAAPLALALVLGGCALGNPSIADIKYNPGRYQDHTVAVEGVVTSSWGVPLVPFKMYKVDDGTGEVTVVSNNGRTPTKGSRVRVKGRVSDVATFGGQSVGLHIEQKDVDFKRR